MAEQNAAIGYAALKKETTKGTPVVPDVYTPYYKQNIATNFNLMEDMPVAGNRFKRYQHLQKIRSHTGQITIMAEANTIGYWLNMLLDRSATVGSNPYTHTFGLSNTALPDSYTLDISYGSQVVRFFGIEARNVNIAWEDEKMQLEVDVAGLGSMYGREIASIATTQITFKTKYGSDPTKGFVAGDLVRVTTVNGSSTLETTIASVDNATQITLAASAAAYAAGDMVVLRPATQSLDLATTPFIWGRTHYFFGATAAAAVSASSDLSNQTRLEPGTELSVAWEFENEEGEPRSGGLDPAALIRTVGDYQFSIKKYFDQPDDIQDWNALEKKALHMIAYAGDTNQYALKVTLNNMTQLTEGLETESNLTEYAEIDYGGNYDPSDGKGFEVIAINAKSSI